MKVMLGFQKSAIDSGLEEAFITAFSKRSIEVEVVAKSAKKLAFDSITSDYDVFIVQEFIDHDDPIKVGELDALSDRYHKLNIILLMPNTRISDDYVSSLFSYGIYGGVFEKDATIDTIVELALSPRSKVDAKSYYNIKTAASVISEDFTPLSEQVINAIVVKLGECSIEECGEVYSAITNKYNDEQNRYLITKLPKEIRFRLKGNSAYAKFDVKPTIIEPEEQKKEGFFNRLKNVKKPKDDGIRIDDFSAPKKKGISISDILGEKPTSKENKATLSIGITGTCVGAGVTHTAFMVAGYLYEQKYKVALVEYNAEPVFGSFVDGEFTTINGVDIYPFTKNLASVYLKNYDYIIYDLGSFAPSGSDLDITRYFSEFLRCDVKIVVLGLKVWQLSGIEALYSRKELYDFRWVAVSPMAELSDIKGIVKEFKYVDYYSIPRCFDPLVRNKDIDEVLENMIGA